MHVDYSKKNYFNFNELSIWQFEKKKKNIYIYIQKDYEYNKIT